MTKEKSQKFNTNLSLNNGPIINEPEFSQELLDGLSKASENFDKAIGG